VGLSREITINQVSLKYLNRLSDLLFVFARTLARSEGGEEIYWQSDRLKD
jgi:cob(I)alamin adenosyltransferase